MRPIRHRWLALGATVLIAVTALGAHAAIAFFTSTRTSNGNTFSTGSIDLSTSVSTAVLTMPTMAPGDKVTAPITVTNAGTASLRYAVKSTTTENTLAAQLDFTIKTGVTTCDNDNFDLSGSAVYGPADLGSTGGTNVIGNPAQGTQGGEHTLTAASSEVLCMQVSLPSVTGSSFQGLSTTATFDFYGEQTANNA